MEPRKEDELNGSKGFSLPLVEHFYTLQGEGFHTGKAAYFIRVGGCDVGCSWCDSRYSWNSDLHPMINVDKIFDIISNSGADSAVITGGEPLMWDMDPLTRLLKEKGIKTFLETSGSYPLTGNWDWICLSPKKNKPPLEDICTLAGELKVIIETAEDFVWAEKYSRLVSPGCKLYLQPEWSNFNRMIFEIVEYIKSNTKWAISLQSHKYMRIP